MEDNTERPSYEPELAEPPNPAATAKYSPLQRLWMMFTSPGEVFADIVIKPSWILVLCVYVVVVVTSSLVVYRHMDHEASARENLEIIGIEIPEDQIEKQVEGAKKRWYLKPAIGVVATPLKLAIAAALFFLMLKLLGSEAKYDSVFSTMLYSYFPPTVVKSVLIAALVAWRGTTTEFGLLKILKSNLASYLPTDLSLPIMTLTAFIDIFVIWALILLVMGFGVVGRISRAKSIVAVSVPWIILALFASGMAALPGLIFK